MSDMFNAAADTLHAAEFGTPFHLHKDGTMSEVVDCPEPYVHFVSVDRDNNEMFENIDYDYDPVCGLSGQHGYSGAIMSSSEFVSGDMLRTIVERLGECVIYLAYVCDYTDFAYEDPDTEVGEIDGWTVVARAVNGEEVYV